MYRKEVNAGLIDSLVTIPGISILQCKLAWISTATMCAVLLSIPTSIFFYFTLKHSNFLIGAVPVFLCGLTLTPLALVLGESTQSPEAISIALPLFVFITILPGIVYPDIAFDVNRSFLTEMIICLLPTSAASISLRLLFSFEENSLELTWNSRAPVSQTPLYAYSVMIAIDFTIIISILLLFSKAELFRKYVMNTDSCTSLENEHIPLLNELAVVNAINISKQYRNNTVLANVNLQLVKGEVAVLLGSNGAGKSTLLRILCGLDAQFNGTVSNSNINKSQRSIGFCPQMDPLWDTLNVEEHLHLFCQLLNIDSTSSFEMLERLELSPYLQTISVNLSGGMKRRLSMCLACAGNPAFLCLDEVSTGCDPKVRDLISTEIILCSDISAVLISTHHSDDVDMYAQRIVFMNDSRVSLDSSIDVFMSKETIQFSTSNIDIKSSFQKFVSEMQGGYSVSSLTTINNRDVSCTTWSIPMEYHQLLLEFIRSHERSSDFTGNWKVHHKSLSGALSNYYTSEEAATSTTSCGMATSVKCCSLSSNNCMSQLLRWHIFQILKLRFLQLFSSPFYVLIAHYIVPFLVVYLICYCFQEVRCNKLKLSSHSVGEVGEVIWSNFAINDVSDGTADVSSYRTSDWCGSMNSDELISLSNSEYFNHSRHRFAGVVLNDVVDKWVSGVVDISLPSPILLPPSNTNERIHNQSGNLLGSTMLSAGSDLPQRQYYGYKNMKSNVTLLLNVTSDHAAAIYLRELVQPNLNYDLYSYPYTVRSVRSYEYSTNGNLGAYMIVIFLMILSSMTVKTIIQFRGSGMKHQFHLAGIACSTYWIANYIFDSISLISIFTTIFLGIYAGGSPIKEFFFHTMNTFSKYLIVFCFASTASSYALCVLSTDELSGQLTILVSSVIFGVFMKIFLGREEDLPVLKFASMILLYTCPSFTFTTFCLKYFGVYSSHLAFDAGLLSTDIYIQSELEKLYHLFNILVVQCFVLLALITIIDRQHQQIQTQIYKLYLELFSILARQSVIRSNSSAIISSVLNPLNLSAHDLVRVKASDEETSHIDCESGNNLRQSSVLNAVNVSVNRTLNTYALKNINIDIKPGERIGIMGRNGEGKSSLFKMLSLSDNVPTSGQLSYSSKDSSKYKWNILNSSAVSYIPQFGGLLDSITAKQTRDFFDAIKQCSNKDLAPLLHRKYSNQKVSTLSGGSKKKLALDIALIGSPSILLLDEITSGIDPASAELIISHLISLPTLSTVLLSSHRVDEILRLCSRVIIIENGTVLYDGDPLLFYDTFARNSIEVDLDILNGSLQSILESIAGECGGMPLVHSFGDRRVRITWTQSSIHFSALWTCLLSLAEEKKIKHFKFREIL